MDMKTTSSSLPESKNLSRPFEGIRIIDTSHVLAGPFCSYQLALLGADVIRIEPPTGGDVSRKMGPNKEFNDAELGLAFISQNANKRSLAVDLKTEEGKQILWKLIDTADVFVENYRPGAMDRLGFSADAVKARKPDIIYASMTGFGQEGELSNRPAYDHVVQAFSGMMAANKTLTGEPHRVGFAIIDYVTGLFAAFSIATALFHRQRTGQGQRIDVAMLDAALIIMGQLLTEVAITGDLNRPGGTRAFSGSPISGIFETSDGLLATTANTQKQAVAMLKSLGLDELAADPRLSNWGDYPEMGDEFAPLLKDAFATHPAEHWERILSDASVPAGRVRTLPEILHHPHLQSREVVWPTPPIDGLSKQVTVPGVGFKMASGGPKIDRAPPKRGEHTVEILQSMGFARREIEALISDGIVKSS
ncbi:CaiB/BaiF CoA transferase family protein [Martelella soudanensis]|uniref:CaiB/BaiF CoA transferase family protein n=1 Tax=unclassified Martelella TaxID=2629616 RepID=UPI0015DFC5CC|nr:MULTISPECIES: CoA transferase [unclassified Martelella]